MKEQIINKFIESPIQCSVAIIILLIGLAIAIRIVGNPIPHIIDRLSSLLPLVIKELKGEAGITGIVNVILSGLLFFLSITFLVKSNIFDFLLPEDISSTICGLLVLLLFVFVLLISLRMVHETERMIKLFKSTNKR